MSTALGAGDILLDIGKGAAEALDPLKAVIGGGTDTVLGAGGIVFDVAGEVAEAFGPLKAALGVISTIYQKYKVRSRSFAQRAFLTNLSAENGRRREKNTRPLFTHS